MPDDAIFAHLPELTAQLGVVHVQALLDRITLVEREPGVVLVRDQTPLDAFVRSDVAMS